MGNSIPDITGFIPVITGRQGIDEMVRAYLHLLSPWALISYPHAISVDIQPGPLDLLIDSGSYGFIKYGGHVTDNGDQISLTTTGPLGEIRITTCDLLNFQEQHARGGFTLDIPPLEGVVSQEEALHLSLTNGLWALKNRRRRDFLLYGALPAVEDTTALCHCATVLAANGVDGIAIGNLVPKRRDQDFIIRTVNALREAVPTHPLHAFGVGQPDRIRILFDLGVSSVDSSSYVRAAMDGKTLTMTSAGGGPCEPVKIDGPSPAEVLTLALNNLCLLRQKTLPPRYTCFGLRRPDRSDSTSP
ncbi:hypothetical protein KKF84_01380 [Myxococcota bacterium]|nr:hypothetical protein [Myxococcota bacterium]